MLLTGKGNSGHFQKRRTLFFFTRSLSRGNILPQPNLRGFYQRLTDLGEGNANSTPLWCNVSPNGGGRLRLTSEGHSPEAQVPTILAYTVLYFCILILCFSVLGVSIVISLSSHILS